MSLPWNLRQQVIRYGGTFGPEMAGFIQDNLDAIDTGGGLAPLYIDVVNQQVSIGVAPPVTPFRKFWVQNICADMTVDGEVTGHDAISCRYAATGIGTAAINPDGVYGTLWYNPTANAHFTGAGAAVRGNAYTINTVGVTCDVDNLIGVYGRARHESVLGTVINAIALYSDGAQKGAGAGTITNAFGLWMQPPGNAIATNTYGLYFNGAFPQGNLFAPVNTDILHVVSGTGSHKFQASNTGYSQVTVNGVFEQHANGGNRHMRIVSTSANDTVGLECAVSGLTSVYFLNGNSHGQIQVNGAIQFDIDTAGRPLFTALAAMSYANDAAAATAGVQINGLYNTAGVVHVRIS